MLMDVCRTTHAAESKSLRNQFTITSPVDPVQSGKQSRFTG